MSKAILEKIILEETKDLPLETLNEVIDFIQFIKTKKLKNIVEKSFEKNINTKLTELTQLYLVHLEEEFANYKEIYPHE